MSDSRIGGGVTNHTFTAIFVFGTLIGSFIRLGIRILPTRIVDSVIERL